MQTEAARECITVAQVLDNGGPDTLCILAQMQQVSAENQNKWFAGLPAHGARCLR